MEHIGQNSVHRKWVELVCVARALVVMWSVGFLNLANVFAISHSLTLSITLHNIAPAVPKFLCHHPLLNVASSPTHGSQSHFAVYGAVHEHSSTQKLTTTCPLRLYPACIDWLNDQLID